MGKSTISGPFSIAMLNYQRVSLVEVCRNVWMLLCRVCYPSDPNWSLLDGGHHEPSADWCSKTTRACGSVEDTLRNVTALGCLAAKDCLVLMSTTKIRECQLQCRVCQCMPFIVSMVLLILQWGWEIDDHCSGGIPWIDPTAFACWLSSQKDSTDVLVGFQISNRPNHLQPPVVSVVEALTW